MSLQVLDLWILDCLFDDLSLLFNRGISSLALSLRYCWFEGALSRAYFNLVDFLVGDLPDGDLWQAEGTLSCGQVLAIRGEAHALERSWSAWLQEFNLLGVTGWVNDKARTCQVADIAINRVHLQWVGAFTRSSDYFLKCHLLERSLLLLASLCTDSCRWIWIEWQPSQLLQLLNRFLYFFDHFLLVNPYVSIVSATVCFCVLSLRWFFIYTTFNQKQKESKLI